MSILGKARMITLGFIMLLLIVGARPVFGITWGIEDSENIYSNVCMMGVSADVNGERIKVGMCTGTLINSKVVLTAGHCIDYIWSMEGVFGPDNVFVEVFFDPDLFSANPGEGLAVEEYIAHPDYSSINNANPHDVGALILRKPIKRIEPAMLPELGKLDELKNEGVLGSGPDRGKFIVVGFGASLEWPPPVINYYFIRQYAESEYRGLLPAWLNLSQNKATGDGGSCSGDSGGPVFWHDEETGDDILVGITSWGDPNCISSSFNYRADIQETLDFIEEVLSSLRKH